MSGLDEELISLHLGDEKEDWELNEEYDDDNLHYHVEFEPKNASTIEEVKEFSVFLNMDRVKTFTYIRKEKEEL